MNNPHRHNIIMRGLLWTQWHVICNACSCYVCVTVWENKFGPDQDLNPYVLKCPNLEANMPGTSMEEESFYQVLYQLSYLRPVFEQVCLTHSGAVFPVWSVILTNNCYICLEPVVFSNYICNIWFKYTSWTRYRDR